MDGQQVHRARAVLEDTEQARTLSRVAPSAAAGIELRVLPGRDGLHAAVVVEKADLHRALAAASRQGGAARQPAGQVAQLGLGLDLLDRDDVGVQGVHERRERVHVRGRDAELADVEGADAQGAAAGGEVPGAGEGERREQDQGAAVAPG